MSRLLQERVEKLLGAPVTFERELSGGDISGAILLTLAHGEQIVAKRGATVMAEAKMLRSIAASGAPTPKVLAAEKGLLLQEFIPNDGKGSWDSLLAGLDLLHIMQGDRYGWEDDYAFGKVAIPNRNDGNWPTFWAENRLLCHSRFLDHALTYRIDRLAYRLSSRLPATPPACLLHGDLWGGNILWNSGELVGLIDPACYFGDREVDYAMLALFDDPPQSFFEEAELEPGWQERQLIYQLWPILVHIRLFGDSYRGAATAILDRLGI